MASRKGPGPSIKNPATYAAISNGVIKHGVKKGVHHKGGKK